jgi:hypothetical protein
MTAYSSFKPGGVSSLTAGTGTSVNTSTGAVTVWVSGQFTSTFTIANNTTATSTNTGALVVYGGVGIGKDLYIGGNAYANGAAVVTSATINQYASQITIFAGTDTAINTTTGAITVWNTSTLQSVTNRGAATTNIISITNATQSFSTITGALTISGGVGIGKDLYVGGNAYIGGAIAITTATIAQYAAGANIFVAGTDTAISTVSNVVNIWNTSTLASVTARGSTTPSQISVTNTTSSVSTTTGAVVISGGLGVGEAINASLIYENGARVVTTATAQQFGVSYIAAGTDIFVNTNTGVVTVSDISTLQSVTTRGASSNKIITLSNLTESTGTISGALVVSGGVGIGKNLTVGGKVTAAIVTATTVNATEAFINNLSVITVDSAGTINAAQINGYSITSSYLTVNTATFLSAATFLGPISFQQTTLDTYVTTVTTTATVLVGNFSIQQYRSCKAMIQIEDPGVNYQMLEIVMIFDQSGAIYKSEYGIISTNPQESGSFSADYSSPYIRLFFTAFTPSTKTITVTKTSIPRRDFTGVI